MYKAAGRHVEGKIVADEGLNLFILRKRQVKIRTSLFLPGPLLRTHAAKQIMLPAGKSKH